MAAPSTGVGQSDCLSEANAATKPQQTNYIQHSSAILNRCQSIQSGIQLNQHQIVQKLPTAILSTQKVTSQQFDKTSGSNIISYRLTQKNSMNAGQTAQRLNVFQRPGNNVKVINGYGLPQINETGINNESDKSSNCSPLQYKISPNVTPGWVRQISEGDIVYVR